MENHRKQDAAGFWERKHKGEGLQRSTGNSQQPVAWWEPAALKIGVVETGAKMEVPFLTSA